MARDDEVGFWMWAEACDRLARAERLHGQFFEPQRAASHLPVWQPPVDLLETEREVMVIVALPGVGADAVEAAIEDGVLVVAGRRSLPPELRAAAIHRLELPQGRFERRIPLPRGRYSAAVRHAMQDGCLVVRLDKT
jgi:HSP20 family molecular chaperone IbpA